MDPSRNVTLAFGPASACEELLEVDYWLNKPALEPSARQLRDAALLLQAYKIVKPAYGSSASNVMIHMRFGDVWGAAVNHPSYVQATCKYIAEALSLHKSLFINASATIIVSKETPHHPCIAYVKEAALSLSLPITTVSGSVASDFLLLASARTMLVTGVSSFSDTAMLFSSHLQHVYSFAWNSCEDCIMLVAEGHYRSMRHNFSVPSLQEAVPRAVIHRFLLKNFTRTWSAGAASQVPVHQDVRRIQDIIQPFASLHACCFVPTRTLITWVLANLHYKTMRVVDHQSSTYPIPSVIYTKPDVDINALTREMTIEQRAYVTVTHTHSLRAVKMLQACVQSNIYKTTHVAWLQEPLAPVSSTWELLAGSGNQVLQAQLPALDIFPTVMKDD